MADLPAGSEEFDPRIDSEAGALMREMNFREVVAIMEQWRISPTQEPPEGTAEQGDGPTGSEGRRGSD